MGVIPLEFTGGDDRRSLALAGDVTVTITGLEGTARPRQKVKATITYADGKTREIELLCRIDTEVEIAYVENGGVLHYVLRSLAKAA
jgi:aconitate hydratase